MSPDIVVLLTVLAAIAVTGAIIAVDKIMKAAGFEGGPPYRKKLNRKKMYKRLYKTMRPLEAAVRRLQTLERLQKEKPSPHAIAGMLSDDIIDPGFLEEIKSADLPYAPLLVWKKKWTTKGRQWSAWHGEWPDTISELKPGATTAYKIAFDLQLQIVMQEIVRQEVRCRELQSEVTTICTDLGIEPVTVFEETKPDEEALLPSPTKREELQKLRVRVAELEEEVLAEQGGQGPLRRPAGIPRDN